MASLDIFHNDAFNMIQLTTAVERNPYLPQGIGSLELFEPDPIRTKAMAVELAPPIRAILEKVRPAEIAARKKAAAARLRLAHRGKVKGTAIARITRERGTTRVASAER